MKRFTLAVVGAALALAVFAGPAVAEAGTDQRFKVVFANTVEKAAIVGTGPISGSGTIYFVDYVDNPDGSFVDIYRAEFPGGTFVFTFGGVNDSFEFDPRTCVLRLSTSGTYAISDGTGLYQGVSGDVSFSLRVVEVYQQGPRGCSEAGRGIGVASLLGDTALSAAA